jgi:hypothetical protein
VPSLSALGALGPRGEDRSELLSAASDLQRLKAAVQDGLPRPWRRLGRGVRSLSEDVSESLELVVAAFQADCALAVERINAAAQDALDAAGARAEKMVSDVQVTKRLFDAAPEEFLPLLSELALRELPEQEAETPATLALDALGTRYVSRITGAASTPAPGLGLGIMLSVMAAEVTLDAKRMYEAASQAYQHYLNEHRLRTLAADPDWVTRHQQVQIRLQDGIGRLRALLAASRNDHSAVRAVLLFVQDLIDATVIFSPRF